MGASDVRIGLSADNGTGEPARMSGSGFRKLEGNTWVFSSAEELGSGRLDDGGRTWAEGAPASKWSLRGEVMAEPAANNRRSAAQVAELVVSDLVVGQNQPETRLALETKLRAEIGDNAVVICKVEAEISFEGTPMGRVKSVYSLYSVEGEDKVEIYRGMRGESGAAPLAVVRAGEQYVVEDNSFFFKLGPGEHELLFSMSAHATSPQYANASLGYPGGSASLKAEASLRVE